MVADLIGVIYILMYIGPNKIMVIEYDENALGKNIILWKNQIRSDHQFSSSLQSETPNRKDS